MTISIPVATLINSTDVQDKTAVFDTTQHIYWYSSGAKYQSDGTIYENSGDPVFVPLWDAGGTYEVGDLVYKDGVTNIAEIGTLPLAPGEYVPAPTEGLDSSVWATRYSKINSVPSGFLPNKTNTLGSTNRATKWYMSRNGLNSYECTGRFIEQYTLSTAWNLDTRTNLNNGFIFDASVYGLEWNNDGSRCFIASSTGITQYSAATNYRVGGLTPVFTLAISGLNSFTFSSDGTTFYTGSSLNGTLTRWDTTVNWQLSGATTAAALTTPATEIKSIRVDTSNEEFYLCSTVAGFDKILHYTAPAPHTINTATLTEVKTLDSDILGAVFHSNGLYFWGQAYGEARQYAMNVAGQIKDSIFNPAKHRIEEIQGSIILTWDLRSSFCEFSLYDLDFNEINYNYNTSNPTYYTVLTGDSIENVATVFEAQYGVGNFVTAWLPETIIYDDTGLYIRTQLTAPPQEVKTLTTPGFYPIYVPNQIPGFVAIGATNKTAPLDRYNYTYAESDDNEMTYIVTSTEPFDTLALGKVKGTNASVVFKDPGGNIVTTVDAEINTSRDSSNKLAKYPTTTVYYSDTIMLAGSTVEVTIITDVGEKVQLGNIILAMSADAGFSNLTISNKYKDFSVFEYDPFGNPLYTERAKVAVYSGTVDIDIEDYDETDRLMTSLGKNLVVMNGSVNGADNTQPDGQYVFGATVRVGRIMTFDQRTSVDDDAIDQTATYSFTLEELA